MEETNTELCLRITWGNHLGCWESCQMSKWKYRIPSYIEISNKWGIHFWHNYVLRNVWDWLILKNVLYLLFIWYSDLTGCLVFYLASRWLWRASLKRWYLNWELKGEGEWSWKHQGQELGLIEGWIGDGVPNQVGGVDRGQIIWGSLCPGKDGEFYLKYITKPLKHVKHGRGAIDQI